MYSSLNKTQGLPMIWLGPSCKGSPPLHHLSETESKQPFLGGKKQKTKKNPALSDLIAFSPHRKTFCQDLLSLFHGSISSLSGTHTRKSDEQPGQSLSQGFRCFSLGTSEVYSCLPEVCMSKYICWWGQHLKGPADYSCLNLGGQ